MSTKPDLHGINEQYRLARGTEKPFDYDPDAWAEIRAARRAERLAEERARKEAENEPKRPAHRPKGARDKKPRKKRASKAKPGPRGKSGRITVCSTEKRCKGKKT